jgi:hypothetical protein
MVFVPEDINPNVKAGKIDCILDQIPEAVNDLWAALNYWLLG